MHRYQPQEVDRLRRYGEPVKIATEDELADDTAGYVDFDADSDADGGGGPGSSSSSLSDSDIDAL